MFVHRSERVGHGRVACEVDGRAHEIPTDMGADLTAEPAGRFEIRDFGHQLFGGDPGDDLLDQAQDGGAPADGGALRDAQVPGPGPRSTPAATTGDAGPERPTSFDCPPFPVAHTGVTTSVAPGAGGWSGGWPGR